MRLSIFVFLLFSYACHNPSETQQNWTIIFKNDKNGNILLGSKGKLIDAIRKGASVRIGWGAKGKNHRIEHLSNPIWLAVLDEQEVMAHLGPQVLSIVDWEDLTSSYSDSSKLVEEWRVVITTKGTFDAVWYNRSAFQQIKRVPQRHLLTWFVKDINRNSKATLRATKKVVLNSF